MLFNSYAFLLVFLPAALFAPLGALALLRAQNGGYGFSRIDLSLFALGIPWVGEPNYLWGAALILLSYLVPLILAALLGQRFHGMARASLGAIVAAFLIFAGVDLLFLSLPGASPVLVMNTPVAPFEYSMKTVTLSSTSMLWYRPNWQKPRMQLGIPNSHCKGSSWCGH